MVSDARPLRDRLVADGVYTLVLRIGNMCLAAVLGIITARALGPHGRGVVALPMVDAALVTAAFAGLTSATSYFMLREHAGRAVLRAGLWSIAVFVTLGALATVVIAVIAHHPWAALPATLSLPGTAVLMLAYGYAVGTHRVRINTTLAVINTCTVLSMTLVALFIAGRTPLAAIVAWVLAGDTLAALVLVWLYRDSRRLPSQPIALRAYASYVMRTGTISLVTLLNYRADVYIVAVFTDPAMLGMYTLAVTAAETLLTATQVSAVVTSPHVGSMERDAAALLTARCVRHNMLIASICCGALAFGAPFLVKALYGAAFLPMVPALRILLIGVLALSLGSPISSFFTLRLGRPEVVLVLASASAVICIVTSLVLVPRIGLAGAALASTVAYLASQGAGVLYFGVVSGIGASRLLVPERRDVGVYLAVISTLARRLARKPVVPRSS